MRTPVVVTFVVANVVELEEVGRETTSLCTGTYCLQRSPPHKEDLPPEVWHTGSNIRLKSCYFVLGAERDDIPPTSTPSPDTVSTPSQKDTLSSPSFPYTIKPSEWFIFSFVRNPLGRFFSG